MQPSTAFALMRRIPEGFLETYPLSRINGGSANGPVQMVMGHSEDAHQWASPGQPPPEVWAIEPQSYGGVSVSDQHAFVAYNLRMIKSTEPVNKGAIDHGRLDGTGPDVMVTGTLTGCTLIFQSNAGRTDIRLSHIQPGGSRGTGSAEEADIRANGVLNGAAGTHFFGPSDFTPEQYGANVIGFRSAAGDWSIYAQISTRSLPRRISRVHRIL